MEKVILVKYGELTTKKDNRKEFIKVLKNNILKQLRNYNVTIKYDMSRMYIYTNEIDLDSVLNKVKNVFGLHAIVLCEIVESDIEIVKYKVLELIKNKSFKTFKVNTKRSNKNYPINSQEYNKIMGSFILSKIDTKVDVHKPELIIDIEIRIDKTYIYFNEIPCLGGYPVGIQGKGLLMLSGGIDSPVAGYLALKRGISIECLYFESPPHTSIEAKNKVTELAHILNEYSLNIKLHVISLTEIQEAIYKNIPDTYMITILRRMMYRIANIVAKKRNCKIIINGESIGQVASQTLTSINVIGSVSTMQIIRPVACFDKLEIIDIAKKIKTYETSILPYEDCCTIFVPKHPVINPDLNKVLEYEKLIDYDDMIYRATKNIEVITDFNEKKYKDLL